MSDAGAWLERHRPWLLWLAHQRYGIVDADDAQDIVQIASIKAWQRWDTWEDRGHGRDGWVAAIVGNATRDWQRHCGAGQRAYSRLNEAPCPDAEEIAVLRLTLLEVWTLLTSVERTQATLTAAGFKQADRAALLEVPLGTIKSWDYRRQHRLLAMRAA